MICSICHKEIKPGEFFVKCSRCNAVSHSSCWVKNSGCSTPGCEGAPTKQFRCSSDREIQKINTGTGSSRYNPKNIKINRCPVCKKIVLNGEPSEQCPTCSTLYHRECWEKSGGCILNCTESLAISRGEAKTCPYCMMTLRPNDHIKVCPKCGIPHHMDCWEENGGCTTYGCDCKAGQEHSETSIQPANAIMTCPYCQTVIHPNDRVVYCEKCGIPHHEACWAENHGCTTYGCTGDRGTGSVPNSSTEFSSGGNANISIDPNLPPRQNQYGQPPQNKECCSNGCNACFIILLAFMIINFLIGGCCL